MPTIEGIKITHADKIMFPKKGYTKLDVINYYNRIADRMLPFLRNRPLTLQRFPNGIDQEGFYQKNANDYFPPFVKTEEIETEEGTIKQVVCNTKKTLIYLANQGTISFHIWASRIEMIQKPDRVILDLDPATDDFEKVKEAAVLVKNYLKGKGIQPELMTTGQSGLHVWYKIRRMYSFDEVREEVKLFARRLEEHYPDLLTTAVRKNKRKGKIFIDYLRNAYGQTAICPYSLRANEEAGIATPISWSELKALESSSFNTL